MNEGWQIRSCLPTPLLLDEVRARYFSTTETVITVTIALIATVSYLKDGIDAAIALTVAVCGGVATVLKAIPTRTLLAS
ncbi:hypothetical protein [Glycomyces sp. NPDC047010]|uniref:hypothetical protein n=1 Tax=Glycomyces sp. NPDC047010 TaxID=3155023 RepID=UPI0033CA5294